MHEKNQLPPRQLKASPKQNEMSTNNLGRGNAFLFSIMH